MKLTRAFRTSKFKRDTSFLKKVGTERRIPFEVAAPISDYVRALHRNSAAYRAGQLDTVSLEEMMARYGMEN